VYSVVLWSASSRAGEPGGAALHREDPMTGKLVCAVVSILVAMAGCGAAPRPSASVRGAPSPAPAMTTSTVVAAASETTMAIAAPTVATIDLSTLPAAPWSAPRMSAHEAPPTILSAWERADNRDTCAPIATRSLGVAAGARARTSSLPGGWLVEFDRPGLPGVDRQGRECDACGRSVFGISGTPMSPDALLAPDADALAPTYSDGSHAEVEFTDVDGEHVASVTFTVAGQGCVYEVWSLVGPEHLEELVAGLRLVEPAAAHGEALASR
jgi:hypothetical protein